MTISDLIDKHFTPLREQLDDADFAAASLRRRIVRLFVGPVRHVELTGAEIARYVEAQPDELEAAIALLVKRKRLERASSSGAYRIGGGS